MTPKAQLRPCLTGPSGRVCAYALSSLASQPRMRLLRVSTAGAAMNALIRTGSAPSLMPANPSKHGVCITTGRNTAHITNEQEVLYDWHPWAGRLVVVHSVVEKTNGTFARCSLSGDAQGLPLERPLWMFDRAVCSETRPEEHPQVDMAALLALQALLAEMAVGSNALAKTFPEPILSADMTSCDQTQGNDYAPSSDKACSVRVVRPTRQTRPIDEDTAVARSTVTDASEDHGSDDPAFDGTRATPNTKTHKGGQ